MVNTNQLSVFAIKQGQNQITHRVFSRNGQKNFLGAASLSTVVPPPIEFPTNPFLFPGSDITVINPSGANTGSRLDIFVRRSDNKLGWRTSPDGGLTWEQPWTIPPGGGVLNSNVAASSYGSNSVIIYVVGADGQLYRRKFHPPTTWENWELLYPPPPPGVTIVGTPAVIGTPTNSHRVYFRDQNDDIWSQFWAGGSSQAWENHSTLYGSDCVYFPEGVDQEHGDDPVPPGQPQEGFNVFFVKPTTNQVGLSHIHYGTGQVFAYNWSGTATSAPGAAYWNGQYTIPSSGTFHELHAFVRGADSKLYGKFADVIPNGSVIGPAVNPGVPTNWYSLSAQFGNIVGRPEAVTWFGNLT